MSLRSNEQLRLSLIHQLHYFDEELAELLDKAELAPYERHTLVKLLDRYRRRLEEILQDQEKDAVKQEVLIGGTVKICYEDDGMEDCYTIVLPNHANVDEGCISFMSPMGRRLLLSRIGDRVEVESPAAQYAVIVKEVTYKEAM